MADDLLSSVATILSEIAALEVLPRFRNLKSDEIQTKSSAFDLVTEADIRAERRLKPILENLIPGSLLIGEESVAANPELLNRLDDKGVYWIVDPVDGTGNFVAGSDRFAMMIALIEFGVTTHSWIYVPTTDSCAMAKKGAGAWWQNQVLRGRTGASFLTARAEYSENYMPKDLRKRLRMNMKKLASHRNGRSSAWAYLDCARGELDIVLSGRMKPWDHAAGVLLVEESGGRSGMLSDGNPYIAKPFVEEPMLCVHDKAMWVIYRQALVVDDSRVG